MEAEDQNIEKPDAPAEKVRVISRREARVAAMRVIFSAVSLNAAAVAAAGDDSDGGNDNADNATAAAQSRAEGVGALLGGARAREALSDALAQNIIRVFDYRRADIEQWMAESYNRALDCMTVVERAIISAGIAEMLAYPDTPSRVIINEAIELAKTYGSDGGGEVVNGILDDIAKRQRGA